MIAIAIQSTHWAYQQLLQRNCNNFFHVRNHNGTFIVMNERDNFYENDCHIAMEIENGIDMRELSIIVDNFFEKVLELDYAIGNVYDKTDVIIINV